MLWAQPGVWQSWLSGSSPSLSHSRRHKWSLNWSLTKQRLQLWARGSGGVHALLAGLRRGSGSVVELDVVAVREHGKKGATAREPVVGVRGLSRFKFELELNPRRGHEPNCAACACSGRVNV